MNKTKILSALAILLAVSSAHAGIKKIGRINGVDIYRIKTASVFCPSTTTVVIADPARPGSLEVINKAAGPGVVPAAANAGGLVGAAALLRPDRSTTSVNGGNSEANSSASGSGSANTTGGQKVPPGHVNNPSGNH